MEKLFTGVLSSKESPINSCPEVPSTAVRKSHQQLSKNPINSFPKVPSTAVKRSHQQLGKHGTWVPQTRRRLVHAELLPFTVARTAKQGWTDSLKGQAMARLNADKPSQALLVVCSDKDATNILRLTSRNIFAAPIATM